MTKSNLLYSAATTSALVAVALVNHLSSAFSPSIPTHAPILSIPMLTPTSKLYADPAQSRKTGGGISKIPEGDLSFFDPNVCGKLQGSNSLIERISLGAAYGRSSQTPATPSLATESGVADTIKAEEPDEEPTLASHFPASQVPETKRYSSNLTSLINRDIEKGRNGQARSQYWLSCDNITVSNIMKKKGCYLLIENWGKKFLLCFIEYRNNISQRIVEKEIIVQSRFWQWFTKFDVGEKWMSTIHWANDLSEALSPHFQYFNSNILQRCYLNGTIVTC